MKRLFIAVDISEQIKDKTKHLLDSLKELDCDLKIIPLQNLHLTLKFLGEVDKSKVRKIEDILSLASKNFSKFKISIEKAGFFPSRDRINVVWLGVQGSVLPKLMKTINAELSYIRENEHEEIPHLTVARVKSGRNKEELQRWLGKFQDENFGEMMVDKIVLYESELTPEGPLYKRVKEFVLA